MAAKETAKKVVNIAFKVLTCIIFAITLFMMVFTIISVNTLGNKNGGNLFGFKFFIVLSDSMSLSEINKDEPVHFNAGDIVIIRASDDVTAIEDGTIISFISQNSENYGETVTHKIREKKLDKDGELIGYVTYGTNKGKNDEKVVEPEYILGTYSGQVPKVGHFFQFMKTTPGYVVCFLLPFLLLIMSQGITCVRLFRRYKREQMEEMEKERAIIEDERRQAADMMRELQALKAQLAQQSAAADSEKAAEETKPAEENQQNEK